MVWGWGDLVIKCHYQLGTNKVIYRLKLVFQMFNMGIFMLPCMGIFTVWGLGFVMFMFT